MQTSNSGNQDGVDHLITSYLPVLATTAVSLPVLYLLTTLASGGVGNFFPEFLIFLLMAVLLLWGTIHEEKMLMSMALIIGNLAIPIALVLVGLKAGSAISQHGMALLILNGAAWIPVLMLQEIAGGLLKRLRQEDALPAQPGPGVSVILVLLLATLLFLYGDSGIVNGESTVSPLPFAIPFYLVGMALFSLARLIRRAYQHPERPVAISGAFIPRWISLMFTVLVICTVLACLLPKQPQRWFASHHQQSPPPSHMPSYPGVRPATESPGTGQQYTGNHPATPANGQHPSTPRTGNQAGRNAHAAQDGQADGSDGSGEAGGDGSGTGSGSGGGQHGQFGLRAKDTALNAITKAARAGEQSSGQTATTSAHPLTKSQVDAKSRALRQELRTHPARLLKVILLGLLVLVVLALVIYLLWRRFHRQAPWRESDIQRVMREQDPFADPFTAQAARDPQAMVRAAYTTFIAHLWLLGYERKPQQTEFDFAQWLEQHTSLTAPHLWAITEECVRGQYSDTLLTDDQLQRLHEALKACMAEIIGRVSVEALEEKKNAYRRRYAEQQWTARRTHATDQPT